MDKHNHEVHAREIAIIALILRLAELWPNKKLWTLFSLGFEWSVTTTYGTPGVNVGDPIGVVVRSRVDRGTSWYYEIACVLRKTETGWRPENGHLACVLSSGAYHGKRDFTCGRASSQENAMPFPAHEGGGPLAPG